MAGGRVNPSAPRKDASDAEASATESTPYKPYKFALVWEEFRSCRTLFPELQRRYFRTLDEAVAYAERIRSKSTLIYGVYLGDTKPIPDEKRRKAWLKRNQKELRERRN